MLLDSRQVTSDKTRKQDSRHIPPKCIKKQTGMLYFHKRAKIGPLFANFLAVWEGGVGI